MFVGNRKEKENSEKSICSNSPSVCAPYATGLKSRISSTRLSPFSSVCRSTEKVTRNQPGRDSW